MFSVYRRGMTEYVIGKNFLTKKYMLGYPRGVYLTCIPIIILVFYTLGDALVIYLLSYFLFSL